MKIIHSLWTKPALSNDNAVWKGNGGFPNKYYFAVSCWLSFLLARNHFKKVELYTDEIGYKFLIEELRIPYNKVEVVLDEINDIDKELWASGKLYTYLKQEEPFLHIDFDVFLFSKIKEEILNSRFIAQSYEDLYAWHYIERKEYFIKNFKNLPVEFYAGNFINFTYNMGVFGGKDNKLIKDYAEKALNMIRENKNEIQQITDKIRLNDSNVIFEQFFLGGYCKHHKIQPATLLGFNCDFNYREKIKFSHLIGHFKSDLNICEKMENTFRNYFPIAFDNLQKIKNNLV